MRRIRIIRRRNRGVYGLAWPQDYRIELDPELDEALLLEVAIHEAIHVGCNDLSEEAVDRLGKLSADVLWRLGFRLVD
jgi:hypothetical protein